ncbi:MAG TPA: hybrid sensor histidine kinase/response regulator [Chthoniobacteraceae bacterium]|nr:hybrid sensor histidine kinase/response regulator [Chthoniobacteraceae bacterium]
MAKILIVDDTPSARQINAAILSKDGYEIEFASDAPECLRKLPEFKPDVILSDIVMPGMSGFELCRIIKDDARYRQIPLILISSLDQKEDMIHGLESGADEFLQKPAHPAELRARVRTMLRVKRQHDELQETLKLRDDIAHTIVHDMRNPLNVILGTAELLARGTMPAGKSGPGLERIIKQARRLNSLANDLLMTSKIENGRMLLNKQWFRLDGMLSKTLENYEMIARASSHQLVYESAAEPMPEMHGDPDLVIRIFDNLITNALKYSPAGTTVRIRLLHDPGRDIVVGEVADQGSGIPREQQKLIFEKYGTLQNAPESVQQFGLGLYFCKLATEAHKGSISVRANEPFGSVFCLELPRTADGQKAA